MITIRWDILGWEAYHDGERIRGRKWKPGDMPRRFDNPDKCLAWAEREVAAIARRSGGAS